MTNLPLYSFKPNFLIKKIIAMFTFVMLVVLFIAINDNYYGSLALLSLWGGCISTYFIIEICYFKLYIYEDRIEWKTLWGSQKIILYSDVQSINIEVLLKFRPFNTPDIYIKGIDVGIMFRPIWFENKADGTAATNLILTKCNHIQPKKGLTWRQRNYLKNAMVLRFSIIAIILIAFGMLFLH